MPDDATLVEFSDTTGYLTATRARERRWPRTDDDTWDLASSVGATATMVAAGRAMATKDPRGLIDDPFAEPLVRAVGIDFFVKMMDGELDTSPFGDVTPERVQAMVDGMAVRTKFFDDYFTYGHRTAESGRP